MQDTKEKFVELYKKYITREGCDSMLEYLSTSDFFEAPASGKFHSSFKGGLCEHSIYTYMRLKAFAKAEELNFSEETLAICGLLHDVCKIDYYKQDVRNVKVDGQWVQTPFYSIDEKLPYGHGEKSVYIINGFMRLTREEAIAINWHMGGFDDRVKGNNYTVGEAFDKYSLALLLHIADLSATYINENSRNKQK